MSYLGIDFSARPELTGALTSGPALLLESLARRLRTRKGALFYDPEYGSHLPEYLGESFTDRGAEAALLCELDLEEDPRVLSATVTVLSISLSGIELRADLETRLGPFSFVVKADRAHEALYPNMEVTPYGVG